MFKSIKLSRKVIVLVLLGCTILLLGFLSFWMNKAKVSKNSKNNIDKTLNVSIERVITILNENITDRCIINSGNTILIGENKKQLENGYYDIKIEIENAEKKDNKVKIYINKLWKKFNSSLYEQVYAEEVASSINKIWKVCDNTTDLKQFFINKYSESKSEEINSDKISFAQDNICINTEIIDKELVITLRLSVNKCLVER